MTSCKKKKVIKYFQPCVLITTPLKKAVKVTEMHRPLLIENAIVYCLK